MNIDDINKTMPFVEQEGYVAGIVTKVTENAISNPSGRHLRIKFAHIAASIAIVATVFCSGWVYMNNKAAEEAPLDTFLSSISDEEAAMLDYYCVEELYIEEY